MESSSNASASHYEIMTASRDKAFHLYGLGSVCTLPNCQSLQTVPASAYKDCFGKELTELSNGSDNACRPADSYAAIDMGKQEVTPVMHAVISGSTSARTDGEICFSNFGENMSTPSVQLRMDLELEAMESTHSGIYSSLQRRGTTSSWRATNHSYRASNAWSNGG